MTKLPNAYVGFAAPMFFIVLFVLLFTGHTVSAAIVAGGLMVERFILAVLIYKIVSYFETGLALLGFDKNA